MRRKSRCRRPRSPSSAQRTRGNSSDAMSAAPPVKTWGASSTLSSTGPEPCARRSSTSAASSASAAARSSSIGTHCISDKYQQEGKPHPRTDIRSRSRSRPNTRKTPRSWCSELPAVRNPGKSITDDGGEIPLFGGTPIMTEGFARYARRSFIAERPRRTATAPNRPAPVLAAKPARPRLVHLLSRRRPDRLWPVRRGLSDDAKWTQVEIGLVLSIGGIVGLIGQMPGGAIIDAARRERLVAGVAVGGDRRRGARLAAWPIFPVIAAAATLHAAAELRARPGDCRDQPWAGRAEPRSASGSDAMRALPPRQRLCRGTDGRLRLSPVEPLGVSRHLRSGHFTIIALSPNRGSRDRSRAGPWRASSAPNRIPKATSVAPPAAPASAADLCGRRHAATARQRRDAALDGGAS